MFNVDQFTWWSHAIVCGSRTTSDSGPTKIWVSVSKSEVVGSCRQLMCTMQRNALTSQLAPRSGQPLANLRQSHIALGERHFCATDKESNLKNQVDRQRRSSMRDMICESLLECGRYPKMIHKHCRYGSPQRQHHLQSHEWQKSNSGTLGVVTKEKSRNGCCHIHTRRERLGWHYKIKMWQAARSRCTPRVRVSGLISGSALNPPHVQ